MCIADQDNQVDSNYANNNKTNLRFTDIFFFILYAIN